LEEQRAWGPSTAASSADARSAPRRQLSSPARIMPETLSDMYTGCFHPKKKDCNDPAAERITLKLKNDHMLTLAKYNAKGMMIDTMDVTCDIAMQPLVKFEDIGKTIRMRGMMDRSTGVIAGHYRDEREDNGEEKDFWFKADPEQLAADIGVTEGRRIFLLVGGAGSLLMLCVCCVLRSDNEHARMYLLKMLSSTLTMFVGLVVADIVNCMMSANPDYVITNEWRFLVYFLLFVGGWFLLTGASWGAAKKKAKESFDKDSCSGKFLNGSVKLLSQILDDTVAFFGIFAADCMWRYYMISGEEESGGFWGLLYMVVILFFGVIVLVALYKGSNKWRTHLKDPVQKKSGDKDERSCMSYFSTEPAKQGTGDDQENHPNVWTKEVKWAEDSVIATVAAFLVFRVLKLVNITWGDHWYGTGLCYVIVFGLVFGSYKALKIKDNKWPSPRDEHILGSASLRLLGLCVLSSTAWVVVTKLEYGHVMTDMMVFTMAFAIALAVIYALGHFSKKIRQDNRKNGEKADPSEFGFFSAAEPDSDDDGEERMKKHEVAEPMEIGALGIMIGISLFNLMEDLISAIQEDKRLAWTAKHPMITKGFFAIFVCMLTALLWYKLIRPQSKLSRKELKTRIRQEKNRKKKNKLLKIHEDDSESDTADTSEEDMPKKEAGSDYGCFGRTSPQADKTGYRKQPESAYQTKPAQQSWWSTTAAPDGDAGE